LGLGATDVCDGGVVGCDGGVFVFCFGDSGAGEAACCFVATKEEGEEGMPENFCLLSSVVEMQSESLCLFDGDSAVC